MSISSKDILEKTGLKSAKTLTRWHKRGIIPEPVVRTHPSGRGKISYWPDWVLDRCMKLVELQKEGHTLDSALTTMETERLNGNIREVSGEPSLTEILKNEKTKWEGREESDESILTEILKNEKTKWEGREESDESTLTEVLKSKRTTREGREISVMNVFCAVIWGEVKRLGSDENIYTSAALQMDIEKAVGPALILLFNGYNPVLLFNGNDFRVMPDFLVGHHLSNNTTEKKSYLLVPLLPLLREIFGMFGMELPWEPNTYPAPKIWVKGRGRTAEYIFHPAGPGGFAVIRETGKMISAPPNEFGEE